MIETKIFQYGATSIRVFVSDWKADKRTPLKFTCVIEHESHSPSSISATRENALAAERECTESFLAHFAKKDSGVHPATKSLRPSSEPRETPAAAVKPLPPTKKFDKPKADDFEY